MVRIGWLKDTHQPPHDSEGYDGPCKQITEDIQAMFERYDADRWLHTGDPSHPTGDHRGRVPHLRADTYSAFWDYVRGSGYYEELLGIIPGNHDVPLQNFLDSDEKACLYKAIHLNEGVSIIMVNSVGGGTHTGSPTPRDVPGGWGVDYGYIPEYELAWLDEQLERAGDNLKLIFPHHHVQFQRDQSIPHVYSPDDTLRGENMYWVVLNHRRVHDLLSTYEKVVVPQSHAFQFEDEVVRMADGVHYLATKHYYDLENDRTRGTWGLITADRSNIEVLTVEPDGTENALLAREFD